MKHLIITFAGVLLLGLAAPTLAAPCDSVKREMAFGQAATEDAKDEAGFKRAAAEFKKAADKAPDCAAAFFNLGIVQEQAGELAAAKAAYEQYLKLAPRADDAATVEQQIFKLEYRLQRAVEAESKEPSGWKKLEGVWCEVNSCNSIYDLSINGDQTRFVMRPRTINSPWGCRIDETVEFTLEISAAGAIRGMRKAGDKRYEDRCSAGRLPVNQWNYFSAPVTGRLTGQESIIELTWPQYLLSGEFTDNATVRFRRR